ncbi:MAG: hypothetical protein J5I93_03665 [Pirellulaceae bacterium]|nr:hypothetical protein [Pirellulaceae bacterium]
MNAGLLQRHFERMGVRAKVHAETRRNRASGVQIDIGRDSDGEFFDIGVPRDEPADLRVVDVQPQLRHLLLMSEQPDGKHKFLCGHDERHWFVAAVPERAGVSSVREAFDALKPPAVRQLEQRLGVKPRQRNRRRTKASIRQGEWFFVPVGAGLQIDGRIALRNEPISRGGGKPHLCEELVRHAGELVYVSPRHPRGLTEPQFQQLLQRQPHLRNLPWSAQRRNPLVYVRGKVRHPDHKTIVLDGWHQVLMNTETQAAAMRHVAFID